MDRTRIRERLDPQAPDLGRDRDSADGVVLLELARGQWPAAERHARRLGWRTARHDHPDVPTCVLALGRTVAA